MSANNVFKRYELKYMLTQQDYKALRKAMAQHMEMDGYGKHAIHNIYFDTPDFLLIRRSLEKPCYKEKLRVRSYGAYTKDAPVFVEMKKKYQGVVYKRRLNLSQEEAFDFLLEGAPLEETTQIGKELAYFIKHYQNLQPAMALHYEREAFFGRTDADFRMTFDHSIRMSTQQVTLDPSAPCTPLLNDDSVLLEVKMAQGMPLWLTEFFSANHIYKTSFSKYGTAYQKHRLPQRKGEKSHVA